MSQKPATIFIKDSNTMESFIISSSIDLIITGPPYWNEIVYSQDKDQLSTTASYDIFLNQMQNIWRQCALALKPGSILAFWSHDLIRDGIYTPLHNDLERSASVSLDHKMTVVWDRYLHKMVSTKISNNTTSRLQYISIFQKRSDYPKPKLTEKIANFYWHPIWRYKTTPSIFGSKLLFKIIFAIKKRLPYAKSHTSSSFKRFLKDDYVFDSYASECPPEIAELLINNFSEPGDTVLDPFTGSGTSIAVALSAGRRAIGIEINNAAVPTIIKKVGSENVEF